MTDSLDDLPDGFLPDDRPIIADAPLHASNVDHHGDDEVTYRSGEAPPERDYYSRKLTGLVNIQIETISGTRESIPNLRIFSKLPARDEALDYVIRHCGPIVSFTLSNFRDAGGGGIPAAGKTPRSPLPAPRKR